MSAPIWRRSIRLRLTLWYSIFVVILLVALIAVTLLGRQLSSRDYFEDRLTAAASEAMTALALDSGGNPVLNAEISDDDVRVTVLDESGALLLGEREFGFQPKQNRMRTKTRIKGGNWYIKDFPVAVGSTRLWVRCYMSSASVSQMIRTLLAALLIGVPVLMLLTLIGGNLIAKRAMKPLIEITAAAESISGSDDLDRRIQLADSTDEVGRLANAFNSMFERLQRSMEREKRFISDASHELRTPVSVISAQSQFALSPDASPEEKDAALAVIRDRSERAGRMLNQMLLLSRMDSRRLPLHRERLSLTELVQGVSDELRDAAEARGMSLRCDAEPGIELEADELLLTRMLTNLLQNAVQYGREGGQIEVALQARSGRAVLTVRDDGPGIPASAISHIWERFYQVHKDGETEGSGLGLPIVRGIIEAHGGTIRLESEEGKGATFIAEIPM